jgi:hypothetical protein
LTFKCLPDLRNGNLVSSESFGINPNVDRAIETTDDANFANTTDTLELNAHGLVGKFSEFAQRTISGERDC